MPPTEGRAGNICIWFITCCFFIIILVGGAFLVLYITIPESEDTVWFPIVGMVLVGIPWLFWIITCIYRSATLSKSVAADRPPIRAAAVAPASGGATATNVNSGADSPVDSPGGARRVRFGTATVMGPQEGAGGGAGTSGGQVGHEADGDSHATSRSGVSNDEGSSLTSHESEVPLAFSMS